jgi:sigma-B regulation protein RsbQ
MIDTSAIIKKNNIHLTGNPAALKTMVFGHGFGSDQTAFADLAAAFSEDYRILLFDNVGGGAADVNAFSPLRYNTLQGYVTDLTDMLHELELSNITYVGHSVNGMIGLLMAIKQPDIFDKLILLGSSPRYLDEPENGYIGGFNMDALNQLYDAMSTNYYAWASGFSAIMMNQPENPKLAERFAASLSAIRPDIALSVAKVIFEMDHRADLAKTPVPSLIIQTAHDAAVPEVVGHYMHQHMPGSEMVKVNAKGHFPHLSAPQEVISAMRSFL